MHFAAIKLSKKAKNATVATTTKNVRINAVIRETFPTKISKRINRLRDVLDESKQNAGMTCSLC